MELKEIIERLLEETNRDYEKVLNVTKEVEHNLKVMGIDYSLIFSIETEWISFIFIRNGIQCTKSKFDLKSFKVLDEHILIYLIMKSLLDDLQDWQDVINTLQG